MAERFDIWLVVPPNVRHDADGGDVVKLRGRTDAGMCVECGLEVDLARDITPHLRDDQHLFWELGSGFLALMERPMIVHLHGPVSGPVCGAPRPADPMREQTAYRSETTCTDCLATLRPAP